MITYVDTSTLVKLLIQEDGTAEAGLLWDAATALASVSITHVEARAALAAATRQRRITPVAHRTSVSGLEVLWAQLSVVEVDHDLVRLAGDLASGRALRGYDAVHLAAARTIGADVFSSADSQLCSVAADLGFHVANPVAPTTER